MNAGCRIGDTHLQMRNKRTVQKREKTSNNTKFEKIIFLLKFFYKKKQQKKRNPHPQPPDLARGWEARPVASGAAQADRRGGPGQRPEVLLAALQRGLQLDLHLDQLAGRRLHRALHQRLAARGGGAQDRWEALEEGGHLSPPVSRVHSGVARCWCIFVVCCLAGVNFRQTSTDGVLRHRGGTHCARYFFSPLHPPTHPAQRRTLPWGTPNFPKNVQCFAPKPTRSDAKYQP